MNRTKVKLLTNPRDSAGFWSRLTFAWVLPVFIKGYKRPLEKEDLYTVQKEDASFDLGDKLSKNWEDEIVKQKLKKQKPSFIRALLNTFGADYLLVGILAFIEECILRVGQPLFLGGLIRYYNNQETTPYYLGVLYSVGIMLGSFLYLFTHHPFFWGIQHTGMMLRISSCSLLYRKALRLSQASLGKTTVGQMVNLLSNDVNRFDSSVIFLHYLWVGPLQTIIVTVILWGELGPSCIAGILVLILSVPLQSWMGRKFSELRLATALRTDERIRLMNEIVNAMRVIKMYAWEKPFTTLINEARRKEINVIMKTNYYRAINMSLFFTSSKVIVFLALLTYVLTGNVLTAEKVFVTVSLINNVRLSMTLFFPAAISMGAEALISCQRIQNFLLLDEKEESAKIEKCQLRPKPKDCSLEVISITAQWQINSKSNDLEDISLIAKAGQLTVIVGEVGSGKSSMLHAILGELPIKSGTIKVMGKISYAAQEPWIFSGTIKQNILFGQPFWAKRYNEVIKVCALERDLEILPEGDDSIVGERGLSLSGGQKARINLARAIYFDADVYLLDDPLSAVDADVGKQLYDECITNFLRHKVKILVTHQIQLIQSASQIIVLSSGSIAAMGTYSHLMKNSSDFSTLHSSKTADEDPEENVIIPHPLSNELKRRGSRNFSIQNRSDSFLSKTGSQLLRRGSDLSRTDSFYEPDSKDTYKLSVAGVDVSRHSLHHESEHEEDFRKAKKGEETKSTGSIGLNVYGKYLMAGASGVVIAVLVILSLMTQILFTGSDYWLSLWTNKEQILATTTDSNLFTNETLNRNTYVWVYAGMTAALFALSLVRTIIFFIVCMVASKTLHGRMSKAVIETSIKFFDTHPIGQILNRFSKDMGQMDDLLPQTFFDYATIMLVFIGTIVIVAVVNIWYLVPTILLGIVFVFIRSVYLPSARDIKRLEGITRSPVFTHLSSSFNGLATIRAMGVQETFITDFDEHQDLHSSTWFLFLCTTRCFGIWLDALTCVYITAVTFSFLGMEGKVLGGDVGLAISSAMGLSGMFQWGVRQSAEVENQMTSVERIIEYSKIEPETSPDSKKQVKQEDWPSEGKIKFQDVSLIYDSEDPPVLKHLNFEIDSGSKVGIVGRTGAGKSSLLTCLFRLTEPEGQIFVDGVDTSTVELSGLRSSISIIPQDPTLFSGTIRFNLDPFSRYEDEKIWNAIEEVQLKKAVKDMTGGLDAIITEGGGNLSIGQRQLVCLARAILKHNKVLVMDEATANVDPNTDRHIQETIRDKFVDCTVLTIAHRLNTIMDADKIMVMDAGELKEFDEPHELLQQHNSIFSQLVNHSGNSTALRDIAKRTFYARHPAKDKNGYDSGENLTDESQTTRL